MGEDRLDDEEIALVLRRASEIDAGVAVGAAGEAGLPIAAVEAAAAEVGLSPVAVRQAVAELRTGALDQQGAPIVCARVVPLAPAAAVAAVGTYLRGQAMSCARDRGLEQVWRPREDWLATVQRRVDWAAAIRIRSVGEVVVRAVEVEGGTLVRIVAHLDGAAASAPGIGLGVGGSIGAGVALVTGISLQEALVAVAALPGGGIGGFLGWRVGRRVQATQRFRVSDALDGLLDELEQGRAPSRRGWRWLRQYARGGHRRLGGGQTYRL